MNKLSKSVIRLEGIVKDEIPYRDCSSLSKIKCNDECRWQEGKSGYLSYIGLGSKSDPVCVELTKNEIAQKLYESYCSGDERIENIIDILNKFDISEKTIKKYKKEGRLCELLDSTIEQLKENIDKINKSSSWFSSIGINSFILSNLITFMLGRLSSGVSFINVINYGVEYLTKSGMYGYSAAFILCLGIFYYSVLPLFKKIYLYFKNFYDKNLKGSYTAYKNSGLTSMALHIGQNMLMNNAMESFEGDDNFMNMFKQLAGGGEGGLEEILAALGEDYESLLDEDEDFQEFERQRVSRKDKEIKLLEKSGLEKIPETNPKEVLELANIKKFDDKVKVSEDVEDNVVEILRKTYSLSILCSFNDSKLTKKLADRAMFIKNNVYKNNKGYKCKAPFCLTRPIPMKLDIIIKTPSSLIEGDKKILKRINEKLRIVKNTEKYERKKKDFEKELKLAILAQEKIEELGEEFLDKSPIKIAQEMLTGYKIVQTFETISNISPVQNKVNFNKAIIFAHKYLKNKMNIATETYLTFSVSDKVFSIKGNTRIEALRLIDDNITIETYNISLEKEKQKEYTENELIKEVEKLYTVLLDIPGFSLSEE